MHLSLLIISHLQAMGEHCKSVYQLAGFSCTRFIRLEYAPARSQEDTIPHWYHVYKPMGPPWPG